MFRLVLIFATLLFVSVGYGRSHKVHCPAHFRYKQSTGKCVPKGQTYHKPHHPTHHKPHTKPQSTPEVAPEAAPEAPVVDPQPNAEPPTE